MVHNLISPLDITLTCIVKTTYLSKIFFFLKKKIYVVCLNSFSGCSYDNFLCIKISAHFLIKSDENYFMCLCDCIIDSLLTILQYAELKPVPCLTYSDAQNLREACATPILKQVLQLNQLTLLSLYRILANSAAHKVLL